MPDHYGSIAHLTRDPKFDVPEKLPKRTKRKRQQKISTHKLSSRVKEPLNRIGEAGAKVFTTVIGETPGEVATTAALGPAAKGVKLGVVAAKKAFAKGFGAKALAPVVGIISKDGQKLYKTANKLFESGKGQPAIRDSIKKLREREVGKRNKPSVTGLSKEELDAAAALSITDPKQGRIFRKGGPAKGESAKLALVKASQGTKQGSKQTTEGLHKTNKEKMEVEAGTSTASALVRTKKKAAQGFFNKEGTRRIKKASEKELTENEWKALIEEETKRKK